MDLPAGPTLPRSAYPLILMGRGRPNIYGALTMEISRARLGDTERMIPVWRAYAITGLSPERFLGMLTLRDSADRAYLEVFLDSGDNAPAKLVSRKYYEEMLKSWPLEASEDSLLDRLPKMHFVRAGELRAAYIRFEADHRLDLHEGLGVANPPTPNVQITVDVSPEEGRQMLLSLETAQPPMRGTPRRGRGKKTAATYSRWQRAYTKFRKDKKTRHLTDSKIAEMIMSDPDLNPDGHAKSTITKNMKK